MKRNKGITLIEVLIATFILLVIFGVLGAAQQTGIISATSVVDRSELIAKARNTIAKVSYEISSAGADTISVVHCNEEAEECLGDKFYYKIPVTNGDPSVFVEDGVNKGAVKYGADGLMRCSYELKVTMDHKLVRSTICAPEPEECNDNGICDGEETLELCPAECSVCGDEQCTGDEDEFRCCYDCGLCGDGICCEAAGEIWQICGDDCEQPPPPDGDGSGCFLAGTLITMADGSQKPIEEIKVDDIVLSFDEQTGKMKPDTVTRTFLHPEENTYLTVNKHLKVTPIHPVLSKGKWVYIGDLRVGDILTDTYGNDVAIETMTTVQEMVDVYNIEVNPYHTYIANGYVVHNKGWPVSP